MLGNKGVSFCGTLGRLCGVVEGAARQLQARVRAAVNRIRVPVARRILKLAALGRWIVRASSYCGASTLASATTIQFPFIFRYAAM